MIAEIMRTKSQLGNREDADDIIGYIFGKTKHDHAANKISYLCSGNIDLPDPTVKINEQGQFIKISGTDADINAFIAELDEMASNNENVRYPFKHFMVSLAPGEELSQPDWSSIAQRFMSDLGYEKCKWVSVMHCDTDKQHIHIAACTIQEIKPE